MGGVLLSLLLVFVFSFTVCAAHCLQMQSRGGAGAVPAHAAMPSTYHSSSIATAADAPPDIKQAHRKCCEDLPVAEPATVPAHRQLPEAMPAVSPLSYDAAALPGHAPPGWFDPAPEKPDHLTPSLTALSVSRT